MAGAVDEQAWQELSGQVPGALAAWRRAHPRATLTAIEAATAAARQRRQARYLADLVATPPQERVRGPACGGALAARGRQTRAVLTPGQAVPVEIRRRYAVCSACGAGLCPPG